MKLIGWCGFFIVTWILMIIALVTVGRIIYGLKYQKHFIEAKRGK